jgi:hypothetical protein
MSRKSIFLSISVAMLVFPASVLAASLDLVKVVTTPPTPGPDQDVTVTVQSYAVDLNTAQLIWYVDKEPIKQGVAEKTITIHTGDLGEQTTVDLVIIPIYGEKINKQIIIEPSEVDLLWEADTYTPPFYKGKALPTFKSMVKVTAIPRKNAYSSRPESFYYKWTYNRIQGVGEALGMSSTIIRSGWSDSSVPVTVNVSMLNSEWKGSETVNIPGYNPKIVFYEQQPLLGTLFNRGLTSTHTATGNTFSLRAVPYYFSTDNYINKDLVYTWIVKNQVVPTSAEPTNIELVKAGTGKEDFSVSLRIQNPKRILQEGKINSMITLPAEE